MNDREGPPRTAPPRVIPVESLMGGQQEVLLVHQGQTYRLRITRLGKLILTK